MARRGRSRKGGMREPNGRVRRRWADPEGLPTPERFSRGAVERFERPIADDEGRPARPYRVVGLLLGMERRGEISAEEREAGDRFTAAFYLARLAPLHAAALVRNSHSTNGDPFSERVYAARTRVWSAICAVGGLASPAGSCLWHVLGWERSLKDWAQHAVGGRAMTETSAAGILITALHSLAEYPR